MSAAQVVGIVLLVQAAEALVVAVAIHALAIREQQEKIRQQEASRSEAERLKTIQVEEFLQSERRR